MVAIKHKTVFLDTNIFVYFYQSHPVFGPSVRQIFEAMSLGKMKAYTSVISLVELLSFGGDEKQIAVLQNHFLETPNLSVLDLDQSVSIDAARIRRVYGFRTPDAIQLATALNSKAEVFISNDTQLSRFKELKVEVIG